MIDKTVTSIVRAADRFSIEFSDGSGVSLSSVEDVRALADKLSDETFWLYMWCAWWLARDANLTSNVLPVGRFILDSAAAQVFRKQ